MQTDIRLPPGFLRLSKVMRLRRQEGDASAMCLRCLELWCARNNRADGDLSGLDDAAIEAAAGWMGKRGAFVKVLCDLRFMDGEAGAYFLTDWMHFKTGKRVLHEKHNSEA